MKKPQKKVTSLPKKSVQSPSLSKIHIGLFIIVVSFLSFITFRQVLEFGFWRDDWTFLWASLTKSTIKLPWDLHPGTKYEDLLLINFFGMNPFLWQLFGIFLRVSAALSLALMMFGLTKSKRIAALAGIFFAVSFVALETVSWRSVHIVPVILIFIGIGFYFFSMYLDTQKKLHFLLALLFFIFATIADTARALPVVPMVFFLQFGSWWLSQKRTFQNLYRRGRETALILISIFFVSLLSPAGHTLEDLILLITPIIDKPTILKNFFGSVGNLFLGWIIPIFEQGSLANYIRDYAFFAMYSLIVMVLVSTFFFLRKKSYLGFLCLFFSLWIIIFYVPNWLFDKNLVVAGTHRYIGMAGFGMIALLALLVGSIKDMRAIIALSVLFILFNINTSQRILKNDSEYRLRAKTEMLWNKIDADVPQGEKNSIFMYLGGDALRGYLLDWSGSMPFGIKRKLLPEDFPIPTTDKTLIVNLLCKEGISRPSVGEWTTQTSRIPITRVHAWEVENGKITNVSNRERERLKEEAIKTGCTPLEK